ncbi:hypothetical protein [Gimesia aquarii]|uniref:Uncharacterized protein n=1 Tax=Gimesia aquarii TaxID=2527964 RepID=A0A517WQQ4_9PLAN|nr:hypothetical protein [Gimesia aquarii]QDU07595.1 hypothetical protein V202x_09540 [Gimesia aquarii]
MAVIRENQLKLTLLDAECVNFALKQNHQKIPSTVISVFFGLHGNSRYITSITILRILPVMLLAEGGISITGEKNQDVSGLKMKD